MTVSGGWYPCEHPERPNDPLILWHDRPCVGCYVAARATLLRSPEDETVQRVMPSIVRRTSPYPSVDL